MNVPTPKLKEITMVRGAINTDKILTEAVKVRDRVAGQLQRTETELIAVEKRAVKLSARVAELRDSYMALETAHIGNDAAVVALGGEAYAWDTSADDDTTADDE